LVAVEHLIGFDSVFFTPTALADRMADIGFTATIVDGGFGYTVAGVTTATA
jgi:hypothetical protein